MEWISVEDRLPEINDYVLAFSEGYVYSVHFTRFHSWHCVCDCDEGSSPFNVTHWMPLPKPPKEEEL